MMNENELAVTSGQMRALARYEMTFEDINGKADPGTVWVCFPESYRTTLDDLRAALGNILRRDPSVAEFGAWYYEMTSLDRRFYLNEACGVKFDDDDDDDGGNGKGGGKDDGGSGKAASRAPYSGLPLNESDLFGHIWNRLEEIWIETDDDTNVRMNRFREEFEGFIGEIETFFSNRGRTPQEMEFTDEQKSRYISQFEDADRVKAASGAELELCRRFVDELCGKDDIAALRLKGYACYGGNGLYDCDWAASRDCMIRLYDLTDEPGYANTLGYIYYYGRCTGGVPEYEKAFKMFSVSAANGLHEGLYKLADMYRHGYACKKSEKTAGNLYRLVYNDARRQYLGGVEGSFADAALRMGNVYAQGIGLEKSPETAYEFYLQADYAAKRRAAHGDFYGDVNVIMGIQRALDETRKELPADYFSEYASLPASGYYGLFCSGGYRVNVSIHLIGDSKTIVLLNRLPHRGRTDSEHVLITLGQIGYCRLVSGISMNARDLKTSLRGGPLLSFVYDSCVFNEIERRMEFFCGDSHVAWIACDEYRIYNNGKTAPAGRLLTFASVSFCPGGRIYDYLCDIPDVKPGDRVIVAGYDGETEVIVCAVYEKYESELGLPPEKYKKILRRG